MVKVWRWPKLLTYLECYDIIKESLEFGGSKMTEKCPYCDKQFENSRALGSHVHYVHETQNPAQIYAAEERSESDRKRFQQLFKNCLTDTGLPSPSSTEKIEQAISEIPKGISPTVDQYRDAFSCALRKEKLLKQFEVYIREEEEK